MQRQFLPTLLFSVAPTLGWCISMPTENRHRREDFITFRALTNPYSHGTCGRASIVWEVTKKENFERGNFEQVHVSNSARWVVTETITGSS